MNFFLATLLVASYAQATQVSIDPTDKGQYILTGETYVEASSSTVWETLTDYDHLADFVPPIESSKVISRLGDLVYVDQVQVVKVMWMKHRASVILKIYETPRHELVFEDILRRDFNDFRGSWTLTPTGTGTEIKYELFMAVKDDDAPEFLVKRIARREAVKLLNDLAQEMEHRELK